MISEMYVCVHMCLYVNKHNLIDNYVKTQGMFSMQVRFCILLQIITPKRHRRGNWQCEFMVALVFSVM